LAKIIYLAGAIDCVSPTFATREYLEYLAEGVIE